MSKIQKIEIDFAVPVDVSNEDLTALNEMVQRIAKANESEGCVHWCAGTGNKPIWSQRDAKFLDKPVDTAAPAFGEPQWDTSVYYIETCCRTDHNSEDTPTPPIDPSCQTCTHGPSDEATLKCVTCKRSSPVGDLDNWEASGE